MNLIKRFVRVGITGLLLVLLAACGGDKTALSADEFLAAMVEADYEVVDVIDQVDNSEDRYDAVLFAIDPNEDYMIEYYALVSESEATTMYNNIQRSFKQEMGNKSSNTSVSVGNHSKYTQTVDGQYYVISRIENTLLFAMVETEYKDTVNDIMKAMGY